MSFSTTRLLEILARSKGRRRFAEFEIRNLQNEWSQKSQHSSWCLEDFTLIRLVTILENAFRGCIKELVDEDSDCKKRSVALITKLPNKSIADVMLHIDQDIFTIGDIVSHTVNCGSLTDIVVGMESIYGDSFKTDVADSRERWIEDGGVYKAAFVADVDETFSSIARLFEVRHILVHELPRERPYKREELPKFLDHCNRFIKALSWLVTYKIRGVVPRTQSQKNVESWKRAEFAAGNLSQYFGNQPIISECVEDYHPHAVWNWFAHLASDARSGLSLGQFHSGTIAPVLYANALAQLNAWRLQYLKEHRDRFSLEETVKMASNAEQFGLPPSRYALPTYRPRSKD